MKPPLTEKQSRVLAYIRRYIANTGYPPASREIAEYMGQTQTAAMQHLRSLQKKGAITRQPSIPRSIVVL